MSEGGLEPSAPPVLVERESGRNRGLACGVRENEGPDADRCAPLPRIGATTGATDDLDPAPRNELLFESAEPFEDLRLDEQLDASLTRGLGQRFVEGGQGGPESFGEQQVGGVVGAQRVTSSGSDNAGHVGGGGVDVDR